MEPDVIRMYSSSPPPLEEDEGGVGGDGDDDDDGFSDFAVTNSVSFSEFETATTFDQLRALSATSPPELVGNGRLGGLHETADELKRGGGGCTNSSDVSTSAVNGETLTNGFASHREAASSDDGEDFADFASFSYAHVSARLQEDDAGFGSEHLSNGVDDKPESPADSSPDDRASGDNTETETSFGRPLSTEALEEFGDFSTTGSVPSPPLRDDTPTPAEDDEDFGEFGDFGSTRPDQFDLEGAEFPGSDSFADFSSAPVAGDWQEFDHAEPSEDTDGSWAAFGQTSGPTISETRRDSLTVRNFLLVPG